LIGEGSDGSNAVLDYRRGDVRSHHHQNNNLIITEAIMKDKGIPLSTKYGVKPAIGTCQRCGKENGEILLLGKINEYECTTCRFIAIARHRGELPHECPKCKSYDSFVSNGEYEGRRMPSDLCDECKKTDEECKAEVAKGGVPWKCAYCHSAGVIKAESGFAKEWQKEHPGAGFELTKNNCPVCGK